MMSEKDSSAANLLFGWPWSIRLAPTQLAQPINPGWTFGNVIVNSTNSSAPDIEQEVVSRHSYGRQIGRLMDAVAVLVAQLPADTKTRKQPPAIREFLELVKEVQEIKDAGKAARLARLRCELEALKNEDRAAWEKLVGGIATTTSAR
jgi:hypothetical protein